MILESKNELEIEALKKDIIACGVTRNVSLGFEKLFTVRKSYRF